MSNNRNKKRGSSGRIKLLITIGIIAMLSLVSKSQQLSKDTVVCIIDTTRSYVEYRVNPFPEKYPKFRWQVSIQGHYYDIEWPKKKDFACITFRAIGLNSNFLNPIGPWDIKIQKEKIKGRFIVENDEWVNQQKDFNTLCTRIGSVPSDICSFIIWKQDFESLKTDSVIMHRVSVGYNIILKDCFE